MFNLNVMKTGGIAAAVFVCAFLIILTPFAQAATVPNSASFDHAKTGFQLRDIHTTLRCEQCHIDGIFKNTPRNCAGCHAIGSRVGATPKPAQHVQTNLGCDTCHTSPTSFLVKSYNHAGISDKCASCHNGQYPSVVSKTASHFPTLFPCETCHNSVTSFANARMQHTGISTGCIRCHNGQFPSAESRLPTHSSNSLACEACHTNFVTFDGAFFDHSTTPVAGVCNTCHGVKPRVTAKPIGHFPTTAQCDNSGCHSASNTNNYRSFVGATYSHSPADACSTCHTGSYTNASGKPPTHVLTSTQCSTCHTASTTSNYSSFNCVPAAVNCYTPHETQGVCSTCHNGVVALGKETSHLFTSLACDTCHKSSTTFLGATYVHATPPGVCSTCHNGVAATGKPPYHIATTAACDSSGCHTASISQINTATPTFTGVVYTHTAPIGVCSTCHNGTTGGPKSKPATHVTTSSPCDKCHTASTTINYSSFTCKPKVDCYTPHEIVTACSNCHNGIIAMGKDDGSKAHPPYTPSWQCDLCHKNNTSFKNGAYTHTPPITICSSCHNGAQATGLPATHVATKGLGCDSCHTAINTGNYTHFTGASGGHTHTTADTGKCHSCHGSSAKGTSFYAKHIPLPIGTSCDAGGCHKYTDVPPTFFRGLMNASGHGLVASSDCTTCHDDAKIYKGQGSGGGPYGKPMTHIPTAITNGLGCTACHKVTSYSGSSSWLAEVMNHNNAQGNGTGPNAIYCTTCHAKGVAFSGSMDKKNLTHEKTGYTDCSVSDCHAPLGKRGTSWRRW